MKAIHRVKQYIDEKGFNNSSFEKKNNLSNGYIGTQVKRNADLGESILNRILDNCLDLNAEWLLTGKGRMLKNYEDIYMERSNWIKCDLPEHQSKRFSTESLERVGIRIAEICEIKGIEIHEIAHLCWSEIEKNDDDLLQIVAGNKPAPVSLLKNILRKFPDVEPVWLFTGCGKVIEDDTPNYIAKASKEGVPLLPFETFAGIGDTGIEGVSFDAIEERYVIPLFDGIKIDFMIAVRGSSMYPKYSSGDVVACRLVTEVLFLQWNKVYVIDTISQGVIMKRLKKGKSDDTLVCKSDNESYGEFEIPKTDIRNIALVIGVVRLE